MSENDPASHVPEPKLWSPAEVITLIDTAILDCLRSKDASVRDHNHIAQTIYEDLNNAGLFTHQTPQ
jgi:hypothetical protein